METNVLARLNELRRARKFAAVVTDIDSGRSRLIVEGETDSEILATRPVAEMALSGRSGLIEQHGLRLFVNVYAPPPRIVVIGAVHISQALAGLVAATGHDLTIIDPRPAFATRERFGEVELVSDWPQDALDRQPLDSYTALAAVTHDPKIDDPALIAALEAKCFYVGALGSRKTHAKRSQRLLDAGLSAEQIGRIAAPIGLDIAAVTPAEIAISILAQIIRAFRRGASHTPGEREG
ncbi:XdhC family protein [Ochrobactrum teleogrylli]|uniref:XdhC family protein n=1 Tax=Ochrobactrum teleogrylli TaxID=2479765 RepID=UPI00384CE0B3